MNIKQQMKLANIALMQLDAQLQNNPKLEPMEITSILFRPYNSREDGPSMSAIASLKLRMYANASSKDLNRL